MNRIMLKGGYVVTPQTVLQQDVVLCDGKINLGAAADQADTVIDVAGKYILPGFTDIHFHGYNLFEFTLGLYDDRSKTYDHSDETYKRCFDTVRANLAEFGVTKFYLANFCESIEVLKRCYGQLADYLDGPVDAKLGAKLCGGLLEGPFINRNMAGAQSPDLVSDPSIEAFDRIDDRGTIKLANVVPDSGKKSYELIEYLTKKGIVVGAGHTAATCAQVAEAVKAGLKYCVHFTNGPTGSSYKPFDGGGATEAVLKIDELYAEQICDGFHVNPAYIRDIIKRKGVEKILAVTDCMFVAGSSVKEFTVGSVGGCVSEDGNYLRVVGKANTLFGSNLTMNRGFMNLVNWLTVNMQGIWNRCHEAMKLDDALVDAAKMFASNPCELMGLAKEGHGSIADGAPADLTVLDISGSQGDYQVGVESTIVAGNIVYSAK